MVKDAPISPLFSSFVHNIIKICIFNNKNCFTFMFFFLRKFSAKQVNSVKRNLKVSESTHTLLCLLYQTGSAVQFMFLRAGGFS
jgi:chromosome condensin MukBEF ATPase and DNA-binding subunit MukB